MVTRPDPPDPALLNQALAHVRTGQPAAAERLLARFPADRLPVPMLCLRAELLAAGGGMDAGGGAKGVLAHHRGVGRDGNAQGGGDRLGVGRQRRA